MKNLAMIMVVFFFCHCCGSATGQQDRNNVDTRLIQNLKEVIATKCHLTKLSSGRSVQFINEAVEVKIDFDNSTLRSFWTPEVAVQYIYDAALDPIMAYFFKKSPGQPIRLSSIVFYVDIRPHDIPPLLVFKIGRSDYLNYKEKPEPKEVFFRRMNITAGGEKFRFDAVKAAGIE